MKTIVGERLEVGLRGKMKILSNGEYITGYNWFDLPDNIEIIVLNAGLWVENIFSKYKKRNLKYFEITDNVWPKNISISNLTLLNDTLYTPALKVRSLPRNLRNLWIERYKDHNGFLWNSRLVELDLSQCTDLENLYIQGNELLSLDVSKCARLCHIDCNDSPISDIKVADDNKIETLNCNNTKIESLDLSHLRNLVRLRCRDTMITEKLNLSLCPCLKSIEADVRVLP